MEQLQCVVETFLACFFFYFKFLTQSDDFAKAIALAWWLFFENFKMVLFFQY